MRFERSVAVFMLLSLAMTALGAEEYGSPWPGGGGPRIGLDLTLGTPSASQDVFRSAFPGISLRYITENRLEFSLDYAFMAVEYYYPESPAGPWVGPLPWSSMPARFDSLRGDWLFYHTKHYIAPQVWYVAPLGELGLPLELRLGAGPAVSLIVPAETDDYYPGLSDAFDAFSQTFKAYLGLTFHLGLQYSPLPWLRVGAEYLFVVDSPFDMIRNLGTDAAAWFERGGNFVMYTGVRI